MPILHYRKQLQLSTGQQIMLCTKYCHVLEQTDRMNEKVDLDCDQTEKTTVKAIWNCPCAQGNLVCAEIFVLLIYILLCPQIHSLWGLYRSHAWRSVRWSVDIFCEHYFSATLVRIQYNFTRMIDTKPSCAYCRRVALELFLNELWPLEFLIHMYIVRH